MRLKQRIGDFRVRELLVDNYLQEKGEYRIYRVTKRKITTPEALDILAAEAGVEVGKIGLAGWKDRQGITVQYMSIPHGRVVRMQSQELLIETEGFAVEAFSSEFSRGNAFEINVRNLVSSDLARMRINLPLIRQFGFVDYFDDQRFGNLVHGQGWIAKDLMLGYHEKALRAMIAAPSPRDNDYFIKFKGALDRCWGDWKACRDVAGRYGAHHSVFEALGRDPEDFTSAFNHVSARFRLIHLYAWQSHLWNRAVAQFMRDSIPFEERLMIDCAEGVLVMPASEPSAEIQRRASFRMPGERLEGVEDALELSAYEDILSEEGMIADQLCIEGIGGFFMKGEERSLMVKPLHLRVRPALDDPLNPGARMVRIRFELPRGSYASLLIKRLFAYGPRSSEQRMENAESGDMQRDSRGYRDGNRRDFGGQGGRGYGDRGPAREGRAGFHPGANRERGDHREGGYRGRDEQQGAGGYRGGGDRQAGGGYRGRPEQQGGGGYRGGGDRQAGGGYRGRDEQQGAGGYRGGGDRQSGGGYRGRAEQQGGGYRQQGGYRGRDEQQGGAGYPGRSHQRGRDERSGPARGNEGGAARGRSSDPRRPEERAPAQRHATDGSGRPRPNTDKPGQGHKRGFGIQSDSGSDVKRKPVREDKQSGGYRKGKKESPREAPQSGEDGWS